MWLYRTLRSPWCSPPVSLKSSGIQRHVLPWLIPESCYDIDFQSSSSVMFDSIQRWKGHPVWTNPCWPFRLQMPGQSKSSFFSGQFVLKNGFIFPVGLFFISHWNLMTFVQLTAIRQDMELWSFDMRRTDPTSCLSLRICLIKKVTVF